MPAAERRWIDLHMHSTASDGAFSPGRLMELAHIRGLHACALTDHDTTAGLAEAGAAAARLDLEFVPAIELAAERTRGVLHILGYFIDPASPALNKHLAEIIARRDERNRGILERLAALGIHLEPDAIAREAAGIVGRPHIAQALVRIGAARDLPDAFARFLGNGAAAQVERRTAPAAEVIGAIRAAGGIASLAHPTQLKCESALELETVLHDLRDSGLQAIEVRHPDHAPAQADDFLELAQRLQLIPTGGSDFHALATRIEHGVGFGKVRVPYEWLAQLRQAVSGK
jgi:predicted metal-dependent phosphoesterase TrpH